MDISKIKQLVKQNGDKFILVENGEPEIVMMSFREYEKLFHNTHQRMMTNAANDNFVARESIRRRFEFSEVGHEGTPETEVILSHDSGPSALPARLEDIRLEDLPI